MLTRNLFAATNLVFACNSDNADICHL